MLSIPCAIITIIAFMWCRRSRGYASPRRWWTVLSGGTLSLLVALLSLPEWGELSKIIALLCMPIGIIWLLLGAMAVYSVGPLRWLAVACWLLLSLGGNVWVGSLLMRSLEHPFTDTDPFAMNRLDALVVLGGGTRDGSSITGPSTTRSQLGHSGDRIALAAELYHAGKVPLLITTGSAALNREHNHSQFTAELWQRQGIPLRHIIQIPQPINTSAEMIALADYFAEHEIARVGLVTSAWHLRRSMRLADRHGLEFIPIAADRRGYHHGWRAPYYLPQAQGIDLVQTALWEYLGALVGR